MCCWSQSKTVCLVAAALLWVAGPVQADQSGGQIRLLAVGVGKYTGGLQNLASPARGATLIEELFKSQDLLAGSDVLKDEQGTGEAIRTALKRLREQVLPGETVVVYLSSHGGRQGGHWSFAPHDFDPSHPDSTSLFDVEILGELSPLVAAGHRVLLVLDSCHSGQIRDAAESLMEIPRGEFLLLASSISSQPSLTTADCPLFTRAITEGLMGRADADEDRRVTIAELRRYLSWRVKELIGGFARIPGLRPDVQDIICDSSVAFVDSTSLTRAQISKGRRAVEFDISNEYTSIADVDASPVGTWMTNESTATQINSVDKGRLELTLAANGQYTILFTDTDGTIRQGAGRFVYEPGKSFELDYGSGKDVLRVECLTAVEMRIGIQERWRIATGDTDSTVSKINKSRTITLKRQTPVVASRTSALKPAIDDFQSVINQDLKRSNDARNAVHDAPQVPEDKIGHASRP
jgi:hypothetical protein